VGVLRQTRGKPGSRYQVRVREVVDPVEKQRVWNIAVKAYPPYQDYQEKTDRVIPLFLAEPTAEPTE
jgi:hypothetical protein